MKRNGFTLIEIIVAIGLVALIGIVIGSNIVGMQNKQKDKNYNKIVVRIEDAASTYVGLNKGNSKDTVKSSGTTTITLQQLVNEGLMDEKIVDPRSKDNDTISLSNTITITYSSSTGKFTYKYNGK